MKADDRKRIGMVAKLMVAEAQSAESDRVFSATGFSRENISILHQQLRCVNLAWALRHTKKVKRGDVIGIVGGSFSGLMLACSLAIADDVIVYIFEKEKRLLHKFRDKSHRLLSPNLNSRYLGKRFSPASSAPFFDPPIFKWREATASEVAAEWLRNFEVYREKLPVFSFLGVEVTKENVQHEKNGVLVHTRTGSTPHLKPINVDILIDATGFGEESNPLGVVDYSYWETGHRLIYDHLPHGCRVIISGCGDSGLIEAMHYAIRGFQHEDVKAFWPFGTRLEAHIDVGLKQAKMDEIFKSEEVPRYDGKVISELCWWLDSRFRSENWRCHGWRFLPGEAAIARIIDKEIRPHLLSMFPKQKPKNIEWDKVEGVITRLPMEAQLEIRRKVQPLADEWISRRMAKLLSDVSVGKLLQMRRLHGMARGGLDVVLNGRMPTPFTRQLSAFNTWLMRVLMTFPNVSYRQGAITEVIRDAHGKFCVTFSDGTQEVYDRVITRYGPAGQDPRRALSVPTFSDPHAGNWLLNRETYHVPTSQPRIYQSIEPAIEQISRKLARVLARRGSNASKPLDKFIYASSLMIGPIEALAEDKRYYDPQTWLVQMLRSGSRPVYVENSLLKHSR